MKEPRAYYNENNPYAAQWLRNLIDLGEIAPGIVDERDIWDVVPAELSEFAQCHFFAGIGTWSYAARRAGWKDEWPIWTGSCPCQDFSALGKKKGLAGERHHWPAWFHLISECRPATVLGEQVATPDALAWLDLVHADMEGASYAIWHDDLSAAGFGAPQIRQRLYFVADYAGGGWTSGARLRDSDAAELRRDVSADDCGPGILVGPERARLEGYSGDEDYSAGRSKPSRPASTSGDARSLAGTDGDLSGEGRVQHGGELGGFGRDPRNSSGDVGRPGPTNGFWRDADWLRCRDGKWRPVEPGTFPLVDGASFRLGSGSTYEGLDRIEMLKGYGNAIVAEEATEVIAAFIGHLRDQGRLS